MTSPLLSRCGFTPEPLRNQSGTIDAATGSGHGKAPKGASQPAEPGKGTDELTDHDRYTLEMLDAATEWLTKHSTAYRKMVDGTMGLYQGRRGEFALRMAGLMRACADAAGFPSLAVWLNRRAA